MKKRPGMWAVLPAVLGIVFFAAGTISRVAAQDLPKEFSWYGKSGATNTPVYDQEKPGYWWMPEQIPAGQENTQWGNRGYVFVGTPKPPAPKPAPAPVPAPAEKIVYKERVVEKPVEKTKYLFLNLQNVFFACDSSKLTPLALQTLKENAEVLRANPTVKVLLIGSASPEGKSDYNLKLSERRVAAVKDHLVSKEGIAADRLNTEAKGAIPMDQPSWPFARKVGFLVAK